MGSGIFLEYDEIDLLFLCTSLPACHTQLFETIGSYSRRGVVLLWRNGVKQKHPTASAVGH